MICSFFCWSLMRLSWCEWSGRWWQCNTPRTTSLSRSGEISKHTPLKSRSNRRITSCCHPLQTTWWFMLRVQVCNLSSVTECIRLCANRTIVTSQMNRRRIWIGHGCYPSASLKTHPWETQREFKTCWPTFPQFMNTYSKFHESGYATFASE